MRRKDAPKVHRCYRSDCSQVFSYKSDNHRHWKIRSHLDIRDYQCLICLKEFCQEQQLQKHLRGKNVHRVNAEPEVSESEVSESEESEANVSESEESEANVSESEESEANVSESEESEANVSESEESEANVSESKESESENDNDELSTDNSSMDSDDKRVCDHTAEGELHHDSDISMDEAPNDDLPLPYGGNENAEAVNGQDDEMRRDTDEESVLTDLSDVYFYGNDSMMDMFGPNYFKDLPSSGDSESEDRGDNDPPRNLESPQRF